MEKLQSGKLYLVPVPLGNLGDITLRAIEVLKAVQIVFAEDTRNTGQLFKHLGIKNVLKPFHAHNEHGAIHLMSALLEQGNSIALVSDAGTPGISDPGYLAAHACHQAGFEVTCLPGPTAFVPALVMSGLPCDRFVFEGFLPQKKGRQTALQKIKSETRTIVIYESTHRIEKLILELAEVFAPERPLALVKEVSKIHELVIKATIGEMPDRIKNQNLKGEWVVIIGGHAT